MLAQTTEHGEIKLKNKLEKLPLHSFSSATGGCECLVPAGTLLAVSASQLMAGLFLVPEKGHSGTLLGTGTCINGTKWRLTFIITHEIVNHEIDVKHNFTKISFLLIEINSYFVSGQHY